MITKFKLYKTQTERTERDLLVTEDILSRKRKLDNLNGSQFYGWLSVCENIRMFCGVVKIIKWAFRLTIHEFKLVADYSQEGER